MTKIIKVFSQGQNEWFDSKGQDTITDAPAGLFGAGKTKHIWYVLGFCKSIYILDMWYIQNIYTFAYRGFSPRQL